MFNEPVRIATLLGLVFQAEAELPNIPSAIGLEPVTIDCGGCEWDAEVRIGRTPGFGKPGQNETVDVGNPDDYSDQLAGEVKFYGPGGVTLGSITEVRIVQDSAAGGVCHVVAGDCVEEIKCYGTIEIVIDDNAADPTGWRLRALDGQGGWVSPGDGEVEDSFAPDCGSKEDPQTSSWNVEYWNVADGRWRIIGAVDVKAWCDECK